MTDFKHGESMKPRRFWMKKKGPVTDRLSRAVKYLGPHSGYLNFQGHVWDKDQY